MGAVCVCVCRGGGSIANERGIFVFVFYNNFYEVKEQVQIQLFFPA